MRKIKEFQNDDQNTIKMKPLLNAAEICADTKAGKNLRRFIYLTSFVGSGLFLNGCMAGYVATTPAYVEVARPANPGNGYIWVNNDWAYDRQSKGYIQNNGMWQKQKPRKTYTAGHWETSPRGNYWAKGRWQKVSR